MTTSIGLDKRQYDRRIATPDPLKNLNKPNPSIRRGSWGLWYLATQPWSCVVHSKCWANSSYATRFANYFLGQGETFTAVFFINWTAEYRRRL